ncbi:hypothetical protein Tco_0452205 [Tanacetum coccineum]
MLSLRERIKLDLEARLMGETLVLNRSLDLFLEDYIELSDLNEPFELSRNQGDDLMLTIKEGKVIEEFKTRDEDLDTGINDYLRALMNVPIFVGTFSIMTDFAVLEDMDAYRDEGMGDVIFGEPFLREVGIKTKRFKGRITINNGYDKDLEKEISTKLVECILSGILCVKMDDPNITIEEYIRLEEEKARRHGKVYNWETATYGKIWDNEDVHDLRSVETEFPAIVFNDTLTSEAALSKEALRYFDDLNYFKDFEKEFPAIVYNDAQTSKLGFLTEPTVSPQHIDEFNLKDETSLSECDEEEQNILNFNNLFSFNVIYPNNLKSDKDNDDDKVDIEHSSGDLSVKVVTLM